MLSLLGCLDHIFIFYFLIYSVTNFSLNLGTIKLIGVVQFYSHLFMCTSALQLLSVLVESAYRVPKQSCDLF
jgi:hypothetical protein